MHPKWARDMQRWTAVTKKKVEFSDKWRGGIWHSSSTLMHLPAVASNYLRANILTVFTTGITKMEGHTQGRLKLYYLFEHLIRFTPPSAPSYADMALIFTKNANILVNPPRAALLSIGDPIAIDTEGSGARYAQVTDGLRTILLDLTFRDNRSGLAELLCSARHKLFWGCSDEQRLGMRISAPVTGSFVCLELESTLTRFRCTAHV